MTPNIAAPACPVTLASPKRTDNLPIVVKKTIIALAALAQTAAAQSADAQAVKPDASLWEVLVSGGPVMIPLGILSVIAVMLVSPFAAGQLSPSAT